MFTEDHSKCPSPDVQNELNSLNEKCKACIEERSREGIPVHGKSCETCPIGLKIRALDSKEWHKIDWNSSLWEGFYRN